MRNIHIKYEFKNKERYQDKEVVLICLNANAKGYDCFYGYDKSDKTKNATYLGCQKDPNFDNRLKGVVGPFGPMIRMNEREKKKQTRHHDKWVAVTKENVQDVTLSVEKAAPADEPSIAVSSTIPVMKVA